MINLVYLTFDTETMDAEEKLIYDVGYAIHDETGFCIKEDRFLIAEVYDNPKIMEKAFYKKNIPFYESLLEQGKTRKIMFGEFMMILKKVCHFYDVDFLAAYNLLFDTCAIYDTFNYVFFGYRKPRDKDGKVIHKKKVKTEDDEEKPSFFDFVKDFINTEIIQKEMKYFCLYGMAVDVLLAKKDYVDFAFRNRLFTEKGNIATGAEFAYKFIKNDVDFSEAHTALEDVYIEIEIFKLCRKLNKDYYKEITYTPYRLVKEMCKRLYGQITPQEL